MERHFISITIRHSHPPHSNSDDGFSDRPRRRLFFTTSDPSRWTTTGHKARPKGYFLNRTPPQPGQTRSWEDCELPCYVASFLTIFIIRVGLNAKTDLTIEIWAHQYALERIETSTSYP